MARPSIKCKLLVAADWWRTITRALEAVLGGAGGVDSKVKWPFPAATVTPLCPFYQLKQ